uniref:Uncharacterized protein n=1 Tax=Anopheles coluzzii TaxID=1518534 RepID=A0A8W7PCW2_ANOCL
MGPINLGTHCHAAGELGPVYTSHEESRTTTDNLISSSLTLRLHLQSSHFGTGLMPGLGGASGSGGALLLRCTATIGKLYERYTELELGVPQRDPIPARVTSSGGGRILPSPAGGIVGCRNLWMLILITLALVLHNNYPSLAPLSRPLVPLGSRRKAVQESGATGKAITLFPLLLTLHRCKQPPI